jgi:hypothetical protein
VIMTITGGEELLVLLLAAGAAHIARGAIGAVELKAATAEL